MGKISKKEAGELVDLYRTGNHSQAHLSEKYKISRSYVFCLIHGLNKDTKALSISEIKKINSGHFYEVKDGVISKKCLNCNEVKSVNEENFYFDKEGRIKYSRCKSCHKEQSRKYYKRKNESNGA